jgi:hypothetical protein
MIDYYLKSMTKCNNSDCNSRINCMRYNTAAKENLKNKKVCEFYFGRVVENDILSNFLNIFKI